MQRLQRILGGEVLDNLLDREFPFSPPFDHDRNPRLTSGIAQVVAFKRFVLTEKIRQRQGELASERVLQAG